MFIFAFSICILNYVVLASIIKEFLARGKYSPFYLATVKAIIFWDLVRKWLLEVQRAAMQMLVLSPKNERFSQIRDLNRLTIIIMQGLIGHMLAH